VEQRALIGEAVRTGAAVLASCCALAAQAHELWLMPSAFEPMRGQAVDVDLRIGAGWPGERMARQPEQVLRLALLDAAGERALPGARGVAPVAVAVPQEAGASWLIYRSDRLALTLDAPAFERHLREEGLEHAIQARAERSETTSAGRELYSRCAKTLLRVDGEATGFDRPTGLTLELMLISDPSAAGTGLNLRLGALLRGEPLGGLLIKALPQSGGPSVQARSNAQGVVDLPLKTAGIWLINAVHMQRAPHGSDADWESVWSSLALRVGASAPATQSTSTRGDTSPISAAD
jgi:uncharacterized GH25 family protein